MRRFIRRALIEVWLHCPDCRGVDLHCPTCGVYIEAIWPHPPARFPTALENLCEVCGTGLRLVAIGWEPNPTGELPPLSDHLIGSLNRLERAWQRPSAERPSSKPAKPRRTRAVAAPPASPPPPKPGPCPPNTPRHRLAHWVARGLAPAGLPPATVARGFRKAFDQEPRRDPSRSACRAYSLRELELSLQALGVASPADPLADVWGRSLAALELPSTRMLLSSHAQLIDLDDHRAVVQVTPPWLEMVEKRREILAKALRQAVGWRVEVELIDALLGPA